MSTMGRLVRWVQRRRGYSIGYALIVTKDEDLGERLGDLLYELEFNPVCFADLNPVQEAIKRAIAFRFLVVDCRGICMEDLLALLRARASFRTPTILIGASWQDDTFLESCADRHIVHRLPLAWQQREYRETFLLARMQAI